VTGDDVEQATRAVEPWVTAGARVGFVAKGVVFAVIGALAMELGISGFGAATDTGGAMQTIGESALGRAALLAIAGGLAAYTLWRFVAAATGADEDGRGFPSVLNRLGKTLEGIFHGALTVQAILLLMNLSRPNQDSADDISALVLRIPGGRWLLGAVGIGMAGFAVYQFYRTTILGSLTHLRLDGVSTTVRRVFDFLGRTGTAAMDLVMLTIGWFLLRTSIDYDPEEAAGIAQSLASLTYEPHGRLLLGVVGFGILCFGTFQLFAARYRRIRLVD